MRESEAKTLIWTKDGDQTIAQGNLGKYYISPWLLRDETEFQLTVVRKHDKARKSIGGFSSLANAQWAAENYENYKAS